MDKLSTHVSVLTAKPGGIIYIFPFICVLFLSSVSTVRTSNELSWFNITPIESSQCHNQSTRPCLTLQQFIESNYYRNDSTVVGLMFLPGNHKLSSEFSVKNTNRFVMLSKVRNGAIIMCSGSGRFTIDTVKDIEINGLQFIGCGKNKVVSVTNASLINSSFYGNDNSSTALMVDKSTVVIEDCKFKNNTRGIEFSYNNTNTHDGTSEVVQVRAGGAMNITHSNVTISRCIFDGNSADIGGALYSSDYSNISISQCTFINNDGSVIYTTNYSTINDSQTVYENNTAQVGAVVYALHSDVSFSNSKFYGNEAENKSGVALFYKGNLILDNCEAVGNSADRGGVVHMLYGNLTVRKCSFMHNKARHIAAVIEVERCTELIISASLFSFNEAGHLGIFRISKANLTLLNTTIENNNVDLRGIIYVQNSSVSSRGLVIAGNTVRLGVVYLVRCFASFDGTTHVSNNSASLLIIESDVLFKGISSFRHNFDMESYPLNDSSWALLEGGAITSIQSTLDFLGRTTFTENYSKVHGGAIYAAESTVSLWDVVRIEDNTAMTSGGGIYLYRSVLFCEGNCSVVGNKAMSKGEGGGIYAISSSINVRHESVPNESEHFDRKNSLLSLYLDYNPRILLFQGNSAHLGGGVYFGPYSKLYIVGAQAKIEFKFNSAQLGGAIYVNDDGASSICSSVWFKNLSNVKSECFFQKIYQSSDGYIVKYKENTASILFEGNSANRTGSVLYGGLLDRCTVSQFSDIYYRQYEQFGSITNAMKGMDYFKSLSNLSSHDIEEGEIASKPVRICFCNRMQHNRSCNYHPPPYKVKKGEEFNVSVVAVDQANRSIATKVRTFVSDNNNSDLGDGQDEYKIDAGCNNLTFSIKSDKDSEILKIHADGPCYPRGISTSRVEIQFKNCTCPTGFVEKRSIRVCYCKCDPRIEPYLSTCTASVGVNSSVRLERKSNVWISYFEEHKGYVIYPNCPFDYCRPPELNGDISLDFPRGSDSQCDFNRTGLLCGSCLPNFTLSVGSARCIKCPSLWPAYLVLLLAGVILSGVMLVVAILVLDLTVANGTINGLLFYVNVVGSGSNAFLRIQNPRLRFLAVIIKCLNMTFGFDMCFIKSMSRITKSWLEFLFPSYVLAMILVVILLSKYSRKFAQILGKGNPVAALATMVLIFYAKLLRNTIVIFSFAIIVYPDNSSEVVWSADASVKYFQGLHILLFLVGVVIIIVIFVYTVLLFSWQWLPLLSNKWMFKWVRNTRLNLFMEANLAPYKPKYRFWTGLLLFVRIIISVVTALNFSNNPRLNLLSVGVSMTCLIILKAYIGNSIYKRAALDYLEFTFYFNIALLTVTTFYVHDPFSKEAVATTSVSIALIMFLGIIAFHVVQTVRKIKWVGMLNFKFPRLKRCLTVNNPHPLRLNLLTSRKNEGNSSAPSSTVVCLSPEHIPAVGEEDSWNRNDDQRRLSSFWLSDESYH